MISTTYVKMKKVSKYDSTMLKLIKMASIDMAKSMKISRVEAFLKLMTSKTGEMVFDEETGMWLNGPDAIVDEYHREMYFKRHKKTMS